MTTVNSTEIHAHNINNLGAEDDIDSLTRLASQLRSMLLTITGMGFENFDCLTEIHKENFLWACSDKAREIDEIAERMALDVTINHKKN
jgi:hypothetical protein